MDSAYEGTRVSNSPKQQTSAGSYRLQYRSVCGKCGARRVDQQIGLEATPSEFIDKLVAVFAEVRRVLHPSGQLFVNISDTRSDTREWLGIPHRLVFALQADGWRWEDEVIWAKKAPMPGSQTNRFTRAHEYIFMLNKSRDAFFDGEAVKEPNTSGTIARLASGPVQSIQKHHKWQAVNGERKNPGADYVEATGRTRRSVWLLGPESFAGSHYATFPTKLVEPMILSGSSAYGVCEKCGSPYERVVERTNESNWQERRQNGADSGSLQNGHNASHGNGVTHELPARETVTLGWTATCTCNREGVDYAADDLELIETPTGERVADDPSLVVGRAGMARPRGDNEGRRPITRYEQRRYAAQLRNSPHRERMEQEAGSAFAHYIRTDSSGARPVPQELLDKWIGLGWLERVHLPTFTPMDVTPAVVLDPFAGSGTTLAVALKFGRRAIGIDLDARNMELARQRIEQSQPLLFSL